MFEDVLNLAGKEVATYGSIPDAGTSNLQANHNVGAAPGGFTNEQISNLKNIPAQSTSIAQATNGEYISNLTSMLIDS